MALRTLLIKLNSDPTFTQLCEWVDAHPAPSHAWLTGLWGSARAFFWAGAAERLHVPMLILTPTRDDARDLYEQLRLFLQHPDPEREVLFHFPGRETLPYEHALTDMDVEGERLEVLLRLAGGERPIVVTSVEQAREIIADPVWLLERCMTLTVGQHVDMDKLAIGFLERGYVREPMIETRGQFAIRGGILDIFPPSDLSPWRIEFEGSEIVTIRRFHMQWDESTPSPAPVNEAVIPPARMFAPSAAELKKGLADLERAKGRELVRPLKERLEEDPGGPGLEHYLPYFVPTSEFIEYWPGETLVVVESPGAARVKAGEDDARTARLHAEHKKREQVLPAPEELFRSFEDLGVSLLKRRIIQTGRLKQTAWASPSEEPQVPLTRMPMHLASLPTLVGGSLAPEPPHHLKHDAVDDESAAHWSTIIKGADPMRGNLELLVAEAQALMRLGMELHIVSNNRAEEQRLKQILAERAADLQSPDMLGRMEFHVGALSEGFQYPACRMAVFTDQEIFNRHLGRPKPRRVKGGVYPTQPISDLLELKAGDLAVHRDHGIARYLGVVKLGVDGGETEFVCLLYAGDEKLYVPMDQLRLVEKYVGGDGSPRIHRLGSSAWEKTKQRVKEAVTEMARQLLDIYASRQIQAAHSFPPDNTWQKDFEDAFPYEETPDQARAIKEVKKDMMSEKPMDRLVCGDVGYGKTEVAMRAAFKAVQDRTQVAVLVPTTLLADQHYASFKERMAAYPVRIEYLSRVKNPAEQRVILRDVAQGAVDILIGTHRILSEDVTFAKLGLLVVDEEQHFGVKHKEKMKEIRSTVDVLTLTATPIPRTLYLSLSGIRDISVIETPPLNRLAIRTYVMEYSEEVVREAIVREMARGGQVFFIHNRVQGIEAVAERIKRLVPEARVAVGHGQMSMSELEPVMERFMSRSEDVLVATTIVESGLNYPNVNTILINRADAMGLSQLYQLRGRVGRSDRQAYAYLFYPLGGSITGDAEKRLTTLQEFTELGSGFKIAMRDLEIRGSGDVLGKEQSGQVQAVGFETYCSLLEEAVRELRGQRSEEAPKEVKLSVPVDAFLPSEYVPDTIMRLNIYKRISGAEKNEDLQEIGRELAHRYGPVPEPAQSLLDVAELKLLAREIGLEEIHVGHRTLNFKWRLWVKPKRDLVDRLLADTKRRLRFIPGEQTGLELERPKTALLASIKNILAELQ